METVTVSEFIKQEGLTMEAKHVGEGSPWDPDWKCDAWKCEFKHPSGRVVTFDFYTGEGHRRPRGGKTNPFKRGTVDWHTWNDFHPMRPVAPTPESVLDNLTLDAESIEEVFEDWCSNLGFNTDSRKAEKTYHASQHNALRLKKFLGDTAFRALLQTERL